MNNGWEQKRLGDLCMIISGGTPSKSNAEFWNGDLPFVTARDLKSDRIHGAFLSINSEAVSSSSTKIAQPGSILMLVRGMGLANGIQAGEVASPVAFNQDIRAIIPHPGSMTPRFLLLYLRNCFNIGACDGLLSSAAHGTLKIDADVLKQINIPIPPLDEQRRIVGVLDEAFAGIATARANAEKNLRNARELFESHLNAIFTQDRAKWITRPLADCLELITYGFTNPMPTTALGPFMITAKNVIGGRIDYASARRTSQEAFESLLTDKSRPMIGDVLLTKDGTLGRVAVVDQPEICINQSVALLRPNGRMNPQFMRWLLSSSDYQQRMTDDAGGTTIKHIYISRVDKMSVTFPESVDEQDRLVSKINKFDAETLRLARLYERKLAAFDELKKSLLHQAFSGEL